MFCGGLGMTTTVSVRSRRRGFVLAASASAAALACLMAGACIPPAPEPAPLPAPEAPPPPPPPPALPPPAPPPTPAYDNWMDAPQTPGDWLYRSAGQDRRASFVAPSGAVLFEIICAGGRMQLMRPGTAPAPFRVLTETAERDVDAHERSGALVAELSAHDSLLDAMAFSKGRFAVLTGGLPALYLPAWPEVTRVIEECR